MSVAKVLNEKEIAAELGLKPATVRRLRLQLGMPHFKTAGRIFYRLPSVLAWMDRQEQASKQEPESEEYGVLRRVR